VRLIAGYPVLTGTMSSVSSTGERVVAGRYRLRRQLGQGAMGTVWEAFDEFLRRPVAVKEVLLPPGLPEGHAAELRERTLREARAIAALSHPNVVTLHDVAREDGEPFVVMEYVVAHSLVSVVDLLGPLPQAKAAAVANAVAAGLAAAHQVGITHRDVKPGNVLIGVDGQVKLTDFGIARNVAERTLTSTGIMLGSPAYIAPEVAAGREVTPAADLWGLGATLFAMVEGRPPYDVNGAVLATVNEVVNGEVPKVTADGPLGAIVAALMVKDPAQRISLREVRNRLHPLLPPPSTPLLSEEDLARLNEAATERFVPESAPESSGAENEVSAPLAADPGSLPSPVREGQLAADPGSLPSLAATPGPLPFDAAPRPMIRARRGAVATIFVAVLAVVLFLAAAGGGFALSRYVGGRPILPPAQTTTPTTTTPSNDAPVELAPRKGTATTKEGTSGGGFSVPVPADWVEFIEEVNDELGGSARVYYVSPNGTQLLTVERLIDFYPKHTIGDYIKRLRSATPDVSIEIVYQNDILSLDPAIARESGLELKYRTTANAKELVPNNPAALDQNRATFAHLLPYGGDLWVVSMTVPIEQEDSGDGLFGQIAPDFTVTG
jgi:serine/threonine protein kinase